MNCRCPISPGMNYEQLKQIIRDGKMCTTRWVCRNMDRELRRAEVDRDRRSQYEKRLKQQGLTNEEITRRKGRQRTTKNIRMQAVDLGL